MSSFRKKTLKKRLKVSFVVMSCFLKLINPHPGKFPNTSPCNYPELETEGK